MHPEPNAGDVPARKVDGPAADADPNAAGRGSPWRFGVPVVCLAAGLLLAATHGVAGGAEIRRSDSPRLVDLVREAQHTTADRAALRDQLQHQLDTHHGDSPGTAAALTAITDRADHLGLALGLDQMRGPGLVITLDDARRDARGQFPRDASPDDLVVHQQDVQAVLNALWSSGAEAIQMQDQRILSTSAPRCVGNTLLLNGRTYSPPYVIKVIGNTAAMHAALAAAPLVTLYRQYVVRFGLVYTEEARDSVDVVGHRMPLKLRYAQPAGPITY
jgi:uncharacterized protein YlxW (UPF0749 family)